MLQRLSTKGDFLNDLALQVAGSCGFPFTPVVHLRRGQGGDWLLKEQVIRIGRLELAAPDRLWGVLAHELAHAQAPEREGHKLIFWRRLACGLERAGKLELLRMEVGYREGALKVAREYGLSDLPPLLPFAFAVGDRMALPDGSRWRVLQRFRRGGQPVYRLHAPGWVWTTSEEVLRTQLRQGQAG